MQLSGVLTAAQVNDILKAHNDARKRVSPTASVMPPNEPP